MVVGITPRGLDHMYMPAVLPAHSYDTGLSFDISLTYVKNWIFGEPKNL